MYCFVPRCSSSRQKATPLFRPDSSVAKKWIEILKDIRPDQVFNPSNRNDRVCHIHFNDSEVVKEDIVVNGQEVRTSRIRWNLKPGSIPSIFPGFEITPVTPMLKRKVSMANVITYPKRRVLPSVELPTLNNEQIDTGKVPFGIYFEMEKSGSQALNEIDTTDCEMSLMSLQIVARKIYGDSWRDRLTVVPEESNKEELNPSIENVENSS